MRIKLSYSEPDQSEYSLMWLQDAENNLNHFVQSKLNQYKVFGININYEVEEDEPPRSSD